MRLRQNDFIQNVRIHQILSKENSLGANIKIWGFYVTLFSIDGDHEDSFKLNLPRFIEIIFQVFEENILSIVHYLVIEFNVMSFINKI